MRFRNVLYVDLTKIQSLTVRTICCVYICDSRKSCGDSPHPPFEYNLSALVRVTIRVYALCRPSCVDFALNKYSSFVTGGVHFFLMEDFLFGSVDG